MPRKEIWYLYNDEQPLTQEELALIDLGYPYVSTTVLDPGGLLNEHRHHSNNTHLIIKGSIVICKSRDGSMRIRQKVYLPYSHVDLPRGVDYMGEAGKEGCTFVEGHMLLSPATARRFFRRHTLKTVRKGTEGAFKAEEHEGHEEHEAMDEEHEEHEVMDEEDEGDEEHEEDEEMDEEHEEDEEDEEIDEEDEEIDEEDEEDEGDEEHE
ncbi:hypothetical protein LTR12_008718 [Friedmanniomyces endolithicus]|nr:hypothetical protein LTR74_014091 [Friedmanniomyces endolithicus]KAK1816879.1 hypothetical protein LTR12_008718 [Friedmanniomyces endolithicus]